MGIKMEYGFREYERLKANKQFLNVLPQFGFCEKYSGEWKTLYIPLEECDYFIIEPPYSFQGKEKTEERNIIASVEKEGFYIGKIKEAFHSSDEYIIGKNNKDKLYYVRMSPEGEIVKKETDKTGKIISDVYLYLTRNKELFMLTRIGREPVKTKIFPWIGACNDEIITLVF